NRLYRRRPRAIITGKFRNEFGLLRVPQRTVFLIRVLEFIRRPIFLENGGVLWWLLPPQPQRSQHSRNRCYKTSAVHGVTSILQSSHGSALVLSERAGGQMR